MKSGNDTLQTLTSSEVEKPKTLSQQEGRKNSRTKTGRKMGLTGKEESTVGRSKGFRVTVHMKLSAALTVYVDLGRSFICTTVIMISAPSTTEGVTSKLA